MTDLNKKDELWELAAVCISKRAKAKRLKKGDATEDFLKFVLLSNMNNNLISAYPALRRIQKV